MSGCKMFEEIKDNGHSKIFQCPHCNEKIEIFWNDKSQMLKNYGKKCE